MSVKKYSDARTYFSKTSLMDPRFSPAWIAFAHTFALEGEHDHAVTAYSTCSRMFNGSHLPLMFIGMEQIILSNPQQADEALNAAHAMCEGDPLLANERGVMAFNHGRYEQALGLFQEAINLAQVTQSSEIAWASTYVNLGTCYRKLDRLEDAKNTYKRVLQLDPRNATALAFLGIVHHMLDEIDEAIVRYHETLSIEPINGHVLELLNLALESSAQNKTFLKKAMPLGEEEWARNMRGRGEKAALKAKGKGKEKEMSVAPPPSTSTSAGTATPGTTVDEEMSM